MKTTVMRLQRFLAQGGLASRRKAEELIASGQVKVNGKVVTEPGTNVQPDVDKVFVAGRRILAQRPVYMVLNKPRGYVTTASDPEGRPTVMELVARASGERLFPVGRLDYTTEGVLLLTNDGDLAFALMHPKHGVEKTYHVKVKGTLSVEEIERLRDGVVLDDGEKTRPAKLHVIGDTGLHSWLEITLKEGKNRQIHRMAEAIDHPVLKLQRVTYAGITVDKMKPGEWRALTQSEVEGLRDLVGAKSTIVRKRAPEVKRPRAEVPRQRPRSLAKGRSQGTRSAPHSRQPIASRGSRGDTDRPRFPSPSPRARSSAPSESSPRTAPSDRPRPSSRADRPRPPFQAENKHPPSRADRPRFPSRTDRPQPSSSADGPRSSTRSDRPRPLFQAENKHPSSRADRPRFPSRTDRSRPSSSADGPHSSTPSDRPRPPFQAENKHPSSGADRPRAPFQAEDKHPASRADRPRFPVRTDRPSPASTSSRTDRSSAPVRADRPGLPSRTERPRASPRTDRPSTSPRTDRPSPAKRADRSSSSSRSEHPFDHSPRGSSPAQRSGKASPSRTDRPSGDSPAEDSRGRKPFYRSRGPGAPSSSKPGPRGGASKDRRGGPRR